MIRQTLLASALVLAQAGTASAATLNVNSLADNNAAGTLRAQIAAAAANDTIAFTVSGTITLSLGELVVSKNLTIDAANITLQGGGSGRVLRLAAGTTLDLSGSAAQPVNVTGGVASTGGGILTAGTLSVSNAVISGNSATTGGGLFAEDTAGDTSLTDVVVRNNTAQDGGGVANGSYAGGGSTLSLTDCSVHDNTASGGGPFAGNEGGGILNYGTLEVDGSDVSSNTAGVGGGIYSATTDTGLVFSLSSTDVSENSAKVAGGVFLFGEGEITSQSTVTGNTATGGAPYTTGDGGGILNYGDLLISDSTIGDNTAQKGGGVYSVESLELVDATISDNTATDGFQTIAANRGGGVLSEGSLVATGDTLIESNDAGLGGGLFVQTLGATVSLTETAISANTAVAGAGIGIGDSQAGGGVVELTDCELTGNLAIGGSTGSADENPGGAVLNFGSLEMTGGSVTGNRASSGAGIINEHSLGKACDVGANACSVNADCTSGACSARGVVVLTDVTFEDNRAGLGGAIVNRSEMVVTGSTIVRNRADYGGGVYNDGQGLLSLVNDTFSDNLAGTSVDEQNAVVIDPAGGGNVFNSGATMDALNVTLHGGSIAVRGGLFQIGNSILDESPCSDDTVLVSKGYNLETDDSCGLAGTGDDLNAIAGLDALADNGGPTQTHALGSLSEAINAGHPATPGSNGACAAEDQRGTARTLAATGRCDKGALESSCGNSVVDAAEDCDDGNVTDGDGCDHNCTVTACGNGVKTAGEACDDGNLDDDDYCAGLRCVAGANIGNVCTTDSQCDKPAVDGTCNGIFCTAGNIGAGCSDDDDCDLGPVAGSCDGCGSVRHSCGDGSVESSVEACDDGNAVNTDDCVTGCRDAECGDGYVHDGVEACDDANLQSGDGCTPGCVLEFCGDGIKNNGDEACDDGNADNNDGCRNDCQLSSCGDGVPDFGEDCDDDNNDPGDGCSPTCLIEECGNGILDFGEDCDDSNVTDDDGCDSNCKETGCGNGVVTTGEVCDDGNVDDNDYCRADCGLVTGSCGDGTIQVNVEGCDDGAARLNGDGCDALCQLESCGDGIVNDGAPLGTGEACDDGNDVDGDYCSSDCKTITGTCGDGDVQTNEECDDDNFVSGDGCDASCRGEVCGDDLVNDVGEVCDDGNALSHDYCAADCSAVTGYCGDGITQSRAETCDDGSQCTDGTDCTTAGATACVGIGDGSCAPRSDDGCDANCRTTECGNGVVTTDEECDDGNVDSRDYCSPECESTGSCGDSIVQSGIEHCDSGGVQTRTCEASCHRAICGDGITNALAGEACDDGRQCADGTSCTSDATACAGIGDGSCRTRANDYCSANCRAVTGFCDDGIIQKAVEECDDSNVQSASCEQNCRRPRCGDTFLNTFVGEACDDGNLDDTDACTGVCQDAVCGDGFVRTGVEECDDSGESILCNSDCTASACGDGVLNVTAGESCDDGNVVDDDGCSSTCGGEGVQSDEQAMCILEMNEAGLKLAKAQAREDFGCVKKGMKGVFDTINAQVCLTRDEKDRVSEATAEMLQTETDRCGVRPGFGFSNGTIAAAAAVAENIGFVADLFGPDLNAAIITKLASADGHACQAIVMKSANKMLLGRMRTFNRCKKEQLRGTTLDSAADLATVCFAAVSADARSRANDLQRLGGGRESRCAGVSLDTAFPGECTGLGGTTFDECVDRHAACRMCRLLNEADRLAQDCDLFDDALNNGTCD